MRHASMHPPVRILSRLSAIALLLVLGTAAQADPINVNYSTSMVISDIGVSGSPAVSYQGVTGATVNTLATATYGAVLDPAPSGVGSALSLGAFTFQPPTGGGTTTYDNTPFYLSVTVNSVNGNAQAANPFDLRRGRLPQRHGLGHGLFELHASFVTVGLAGFHLPRGDDRQLQLGRL